MDSEFYLASQHSNKCHCNNSTQMRLISMQIRVLWYFSERSVTRQVKLSEIDSAGRTYQSIYSTSAPLVCRCNLTLVSNACNAAPISLFRAPNGLNKLLEMHFKFPFNLIGKLIMTFLKASHSACSNPGKQVGTQNKDYSAVLQTDLTN